MGSLLCCADDDKYVDYMRQIDRENGSYVPPSNRRNRQHATKAYARFFSLAPLYENKKQQRHKTDLQRNNTIGKEERVK